MCVCVCAVCLRARARACVYVCVIMTVNFCGSRATWLPAIASRRVCFHNVVCAQGEYSAKRFQICLQSKVTHSAKEIDRLFATPTNVETKINCRFGKLSQRFSFQTWRENNIYDEAVAQCEHASTSQTAVSRTVGPQLEPIGAAAASLPARVLWCNGEHSGL